MWTDDVAATDDQRAGVVGLAYLGGICTTDKYSIVEENGAFSSVGVTAHEMGHKYFNIKLYKK